MRLTRVFRSRTEWIAALPLVALFVLASPASSRVDPALPVAPGERVRVTVLVRVAPDSFSTRGLELRQRFVGTLRAVEPGGLTLHTGSGASDTLVLSRATISGLEVRRGRHSRAGRGAIIGLIAGVAGGVVLTSAIGSDSSSDGWRTDYTAPGMAVFALAGLSVGALVGSGSHTDRWQHADLPAAE
jgi:hypothetical protein